MSNRNCNENHVWVDGSCRNNGRGSQARGGYGGYFGNNDPRNFSGSLPASQPHTNQRAELTAVKHALETTQGDPRHLVVHTDSTYARDCVEKWLPNWNQNGERTASGGQVKNMDLIRPIDRMIQERGGNVSFQHVRG